MSDLPVTCFTIYLVGSNTVSDYTGGYNWNNSVNYVYLSPAAGYGLSSAEVDNVLIDLALETWSGLGRTCWLAGNNAARTAASDAAVATLIANNVGVTTN